MNKPFDRTSVNIRQGNSIQYFGRSNKNMKTCLFLLIELDFIEKDDIVVEEINVMEIIEKIG